MPDYVANAGFPGVVGLKSMTYTLTQGISPSVIQAIADPEFGGIPRTVDCFFSDGAHTVVLPNCQVDSAEVDQSLGGKIARINILDRRWMWRFGSISGHYNQPVPRVYDLPPINASGQQTGNPTTPDDADVADCIQERYKKSGRQLCELCLRNMGVANYDVSRVPDDDYPEVNWTAANPARELEALANRYGLRVIWHPPSDSVGLAFIGQGKELPDAIAGDIATDNQGIDPPEAPKKITVFGAPVKYQMRFTLEAVGIDFDGRVKLIDELSYRPDSGWEAKKPPFRFSSSTVFANSPLPGSRTWHDAQNLAAQTVFRLYRIKQTLPVIRNEDEFWIPPNTQYFDYKKRRDQIILLAQRVETGVDDLGQRNVLPATCYGVADRGGPTFKATSEGDEIKIPFAVVSNQQLIRFANYVYRVDRTGASPQYKPATIILETSCHVTDNVTGALVRAIYEFPLGTQQQGARPEQDELPIVREDIQKYYRVGYVDAINNAISTTEQNETACREQAERYAQSEAVPFQVTYPQSRSYNAIMPIFTDGAIQNVAWSVSIGGGVLTQASRNTELASVMPYPVRRKWEEVNLESLRQQRDQRTKQASRIEQIRGDVDPFSL